MKKNFWKKILKYFISIFIIPFLFFTIAEFAIRIINIDTDVVKTENFDLGVPIWVSNDINFSSAEAVYNRIIHNVIPASSAEWMNCFEEAKYVHYKMKPNLSVRVTNTVNKIEIEKGIKVLFESNSEGFRTKDISKKKDKDVIRIVFMGDSVTFGWGVNQEERFSNVLEKKLNSIQNQFRFEVINFGIPGYTSYHGQVVFDKYALKYSPDVIFLSFGANGGRPIPKSAKEMLEKRNRFRGLKYFLQNFEIYKLIRKGLLAGYNPVYF